MPVNEESADFAGLFDGYAPPEKFDQSEDMEELSKRLREWFAASSDARRSY